jgi:hypothetical protein
MQVTVAKIESGNLDVLVGGKSGLYLFKRLEKTGTPR